MTAAVAAAPGRAGRWAAALRGHALLGGMSFLAIFPIYWMVVTSLRAPNEIFSILPWPENPSLENYAYIAFKVPIPRMLLNTFAVASLTTVVQLLTALLAAYAFVRWRNRLTALLFNLMTVTWLIPPQVIMVPNYMLVTQLGLLDSMWALIIPDIASAFAIMMLYHTLRAFPAELIEAALMDGAGHLRILWLVVVPNIGAAIASLGILLFISTWNDYFWPLLVTRSMDNSVIQIGLQMFFSSEGNQWGPLMAAASLASLPILALYAVLQKQIIDSFVKSGLR
jgi:sn-glycerol 3-phosphate transport system permease protein